MTFSLSVYCSWRPVLCGLAGSRLGRPRRGNRALLPLLHVGLAFICAKKIADGFLRATATTLSYDQR